MKLPKKTKLPEKFELLDKRGFELMEKRKSNKNNNKKDSCPLASPHS